MLMDDPADTVKRPRVKAASGGLASVAEPGAAPSVTRWLSGAKRWARFQREARWAPGVSALLIYMLIALAYFWWPIHSHFGTMAINAGISDFGQNLWYLKWWPYAVSHGLNPFITYKMWHAYGYNLSWQTSLPGLSLLALPITATSGVVVAYNSWVILSFALTAWATFILCYHLTRQIWASLVGGYLFGFSGYMLAQATGHIHLIVLFPAPIALYLATLRYEGRISRGRYLALTPLPLLALFLISVEEFALIAIFAYLALGLYLLIGADRRRQTLTLAVELTIAFLITALALTPYLYYMAIGYSKGEVHPIFAYSGDALGFVVPTRVFLPFYKYFHAVPLSCGNQAECDTYVGLPLALLMIVFAIRRWVKPFDRTLILLALIGVAFTLGPTLFIAHVPTIPSPMRLVFRLPLIQKSLPVRYAMFVDLIGAIMAALWLANNVRRQVVKIALGLALTLVLIPNLQTGVFFSPVDVPPFFSTTMYQQYIKPNDNVWILPLNFDRTDMLWQQAANYSFNLTSGYGGFTPPPENALPVNLLFSANEIHNGQPALPQPQTAAAANAYQYYMEQYVATERVNDIVVQERYFTACRAYLEFLREAPLHVGGVWLYPVPPSFSQATLPGEQVAGEPVSRPYALTGSARWDDVAQQLVVPAHTAGEALATLTDTFPSGKYDVTLSISSVSQDPVAYAEIVVNGVTTPVALTNGVTHTSLSVAGKSGSVTIRIISLGGAAFTIGDATMTTAH